MFTITDTINVSINSYFDFIMILVDDRSMAVLVSTFLYFQFFVYFLPCVYVSVHVFAGRYMYVLVHMYMWHMQLKVRSQY